MQCTHFLRGFKKKETARVQIQIVYYNKHILGITDKFD